MAYLKNFSALKVCCGCCRSEKDKQFTDIMDVGIEHLEKDFDFKNILDYTKNQKYETLRFGKIDNPVELKVK